MELLNGFKIYYSKHYLWTREGHSSSSCVVGAILIVEMVLLGQLYILGMSF